MSLSAAKSRVMQAKMYLESKRVDEIEPTLQAAEKFLADLTADEKAPVLAELAAIRATLATMLTPQEERNLSAAKGYVRQARSQLESKQTLGIDDTLRNAEKFLEGIAEKHTAPIVADIAAVRAELGAAVAEPPRAAVVAPERASGAKAPAPTMMVTNIAPRAAPPAPVPAPAPAASAALTDDDHANISRAKSRLLQARSLLESRRTENIEYTLEQAAGFLTDVPESGKAGLLADIEAIRRELGGAVHVEDLRRVESRIERDLGDADGNLTVSFRHSREALDRVTEFLATDEVVTVLAADRIAQYARRAADLEVRLAAAIKADALARAIPILDELEQRLARDPFVGLPQHEAYAATSALNTLKDRILAALRPVPSADVDAVAINRRLVATDQKIEKASAAWGKAVLDAEVGNSWKFIADAIAGWEQEVAQARDLAEPDLPKTRLAIIRIGALLAAPETKQIRADNPDDDTIQATYRTAEQVFEAASKKLYAAYLHMLDAADQLPTPLRRLELDRPTHLAGGIEYAFANTRFAEPVLARIHALDARWKAEVAAIMKARQELYDELAIAADAAWPAIVSALKPASFDPSHVRGTTVLLQGVYNRAGWDFGDYNFAMRADGVPIGGDYEPHVLKALEHAWYELKLDVSNWITWDVIAVIDGPGKIGERTIITLKNKDTNLEIGKLEEWRPIDCIKLRVIALHAGPVAVGPS